MTTIESKEFLKRKALEFIEELNENPAMTIDDEVEAMAKRLGVSALRGQIGKELTAMSRWYTKRATTLLELKPLEDLPSDEGLTISTWTPAYGVTKKIVEKLDEMKSGLEENFDIPSSALSWLFFVLRMLQAELIEKYGKAK